MRVIPKGASKGFSLVEVTIASLIIAIGTTAILSVATTSKMQLKRSDTKEQMNQQARRLVEELKNYVKPASYTGAGGPNGGSWAFPGDTAGGWALGPGDHDVTANLPASLRNAPVNAKLLYTVTVDAGGNRRISVSMKWDED